MSEAHGAVGLLPPPSAAADRPVTIALTAGTVSLAVLGGYSASRRS